MGIASLSIFVLLILLIARYVKFAYRSYQSGIPCAHWSSSFSSLWILWIRYKLREIRTIHEAHARLGPVIRLGHNEVSVNCVKGGIQTIYGGGFDKHGWYSNLFDNYGISNMFSTTDSRPHSTRKRMMSNIYSKSYIHNSVTLRKITEIIIQDRLKPCLERIMNEGTRCDIYPILSATTMDFVTAYLFGIDASSDFIRVEKKRNEFLENYRSRHAFNFYPQEVPVLTSFLERIDWRLVPKWVDEANDDIETWTMSMCKAASKTYDCIMDQEQSVSLASIPEVYRQLRTAMSRVQHAKGDVSDQQSVIASEVLDHLAAGFDTSGITLVYYIHEISKRPDVQEALHKELQDTMHASSSEGDGKEQLLEVKILDNLPLLQATLQETLRLRAAIPGPQPRITPAPGCTIGDGKIYFIPGNTRISAQAHSLHRNKEVFDEPEEWKPERWLDNSDEKLKEMNRWFWAFGSGGRMCVGSNLAIYRMLWEWF